MKRREFVLALGGAAVWPLVARAQQPRRVSRIALLMVNGETDAESETRVAAFRRGLEQVGLSEGRNVQIDYHWAVGSAERAQSVASAMTAVTPDVAVANGTPAVAAMMRLAQPVPRGRHSRSRGRRVRLGYDRASKRPSAARAPAHGPGRLLENP